MSTQGTQHKKTYPTLEAVFAAVASGEIQQSDIARHYEAVMSSETILSLRDIDNLIMAATRIAERLPEETEGMLLPPTKLEDIRDALKGFVEVMNTRGLGVTMKVEGVE